MCLLEYVEGAVINNGCCQAEIKFIGSWHCLNNSECVQQIMLCLAITYFRYKDQIGLLHAYI